MIKKALESEAAKTRQATEALDASLPSSAPAETAQAAECFDIRNAF